MLINVGRVSSDDPGLPNQVVTPCVRTRSMVPWRTVGMSEDLSGWRQSQRQMPRCVPAEFRLKPLSSILTDADGQGNVRADTVRSQQMSVRTLEW